MAIKVGGTTVINDSRALNNITSVDATTVAALGTAGVGGGGGSFDAVASGTIANGALVSLNSDGTVSTTAAALGDNSTFYSGNLDDLVSVYDSNSNKVVIMYIAADLSSRPYAVVGTVSGTSISFGTAVKLSDNYMTWLAMTFDSNSNKVVVAFRDNNDQDKIRSMVGTVSGTSISFGSIVDVTPGSSNSHYTQLAFDSNSNKIVIAYREYNADNGTYASKANVGTVSGTSISFGSAATFENSRCEPTSITFDSNSNKVVILFKHDVDGDDGKAVVGTVSGTSISFGTPVTYTTGNGDDGVCTFDSNSNKVVIAFQDNNNSNYVSGIVGTVSGTSISFGSPVAIGAWTGTNRSITFDSSRNKIFINYKAGNPERGEVVSGVVSGTSITFGLPVIYHTGSFERADTIYDPTTTNVVISYKDQAAGSNGISLVANPNGLINFFKWIGLASESISNTSTGTINVLGGINESQSGLSVGSTYYINGDAALSTTVTTGREVGKALSATKLLITQGSIS